MASSLLLHAREALTRTTTAAGARAFRAALDASTDDAVAAALAPLGDDERFVAMIGVGLLRPPHLAAAARAFVDGLRKDRPFRWRDACDGASVTAWIRAAAPVLDVDGLLAVLDGEDLHVAAAERLRLGDLAGARRLHAAISPLDKRGRAEARARIALASADEADLRAAQDEALCAPVIQDGADETEALAGVLEVWAGALSPEHPAVQRAVDTVVTRGSRYVKGQDEGLAQAAVACADAARPEAPGWLAHARRIHGAITRPGERVAQRIADAERRVAGDASAAPTATAPRPAPFTLEEAARETSFGYRALRAAWVAAHALSTGDAARAEAAFLVAFTPPAAPLSAGEKARWIAARFAAGEPAEAALLALVAACAPEGVLPEAAWALAEARLRGEALTAFVRACLGAGLHLRSFGESHEKRSRLENVARMAAAHGDAALAREVLAAVLAEPEPTPSFDKDRRLRRFQEAVVTLGPRLAPTPRDAAEACLAMLGEHAATLWFAPALALALPDAERLGPPPAAAGPELARARAREGRWDEALKTAAALGDDAAFALASLGALSPPPAVAKKLVAAYKKTPKGRGDAATCWRHRLGSMHLALGDATQALEVLATLPDARVSGVGPRGLAAEIAAFLDARGGWDAARAAALVEALGSGRVLPQDLPGAVLEVLPRAFPHLAAPDPLIDRIRGHLARRPRDLAAVDMARAVALARVSDPRAPEAFAAAVAASESGDASHLAPVHLLLPLSDHPDLPDWDALWARAFPLVNRLGLSTRRRLFALVPQLSPRARRALVAEVRREWPTEVAEPLREVALDLLATEIDDDPTLVFLLDGASTAVEASAAISAAACAAKRRREPDAEALAGLIGLG